jgi:Mg2+ and Co2+ transporter CorA
VTGTPPTTIEANDHLKRRERFPARTEHMTARSALLAAPLVSLALAACAGNLECDGHPCAGSWKCDMALGGHVVRCADGERSHAGDWSTHAPVMAVLGGRRDRHPGEVSVFISRRFVITVRQGAAGGLRIARQRLEAWPELPKEGPAAALWAIIHTIVDDYLPVVEGLDRDVEELEATVFSGATAPTERIYLLRREATDFYRAVHPLLAPLDGIERGCYLNISGELVQFFRDVNDHVKLINEEVAALRDAPAMGPQANMAVISNDQTVINVRQNETVKVLTLVATIFLPLTFLTGFFGMNFAWMTEHLLRSFWSFALAGVGSLLMSCTALYLWFRRAGHISAGARTTASGRHCVRSYEAPRAARTLRDA